MTDDAKLENEGMQLSPGDEVGNCSDCGVVVGDDLSDSFPNGPECPECGEVLQKVVILEEEMEVTPDVVA